MVVLGVDPHKKTHTVVAADEAGRELAVRTFQTTPAGLLELIRWALQFPQRRWAVEDGRHVAGRLLRELVGAGESVTCVPTKLMAQARAGARTRGKSDPIDALAVARAAIREPDLPTAHLDPECLDLRLLVDHRERLVARRTADINIVRWDLVDLDPALEPAGKKMTTQKVLRRLIEQLELLPAGVRRDLAIEKVERILADTIRINQLERDITTRVAPLAPALMALFGTGGLTAAKIMGEVAGIERFATSAKLASHAGIAPIPVWSGKTPRHRLNRGANRQLNCAVHRIALTQARKHPPAIALISRRRANGDTPAGAKRVLKRNLIDVIYRAMKQDAQTRHTASPPTQTQAA